jgi:hypothetical protein
MNIEVLQETIQHLVQKGIDKNYISYISDLREIEVYPRYLQHE